MIVWNHTLDITMNLLRFYKCSIICLTEKKNTFIFQFLVKYQKILNKLFFFLINSLRIFIEFFPNAVINACLFKSKVVSHSRFWANFIDSFAKMVLFS